MSEKRAFPCNECSSIFKQKKNLQQHMKKQHGLKKYKCNYCNFRSDNQFNLSRHEKTMHENEVFRCEQCEYTTPRKDKLRRHIRSKHLEKNMKCEHCNIVIRGYKDPLDTLNVYKAKIRNTINHYLQTKGPTKWYIGMEIIMHKMDKEGKMTDEVVPGFTSNMKTTLHMWNFDELYNECSEKIMKNFVEFNANGSGWILSRVRLISVHMHLIPGINVDGNSEDSNDSDDDI